MRLVGTARKHAPNAQRRRVHLHESRSARTFLFSVRTNLAGQLAPLELVQHLSLHLFSPNSWTHVLAPYV